MGVRGISDALLRCNEIIVPDAVCRPAKPQAALLDGYTFEVLRCSCNYFKDDHKYCSIWVIRQ